VVPLPFLASALHLRADAEGEHGERVIAPVVREDRGQHRLLPVQLPPAARLGEENLLITRPA